MCQLNKNSKIVGEDKLLTTPVRNAIKMLQRDLENVFCDTNAAGAEILLKTEKFERGMFSNKCAVCEQERADSYKDEEDFLLQEQYRIEVNECSVTVFAYGDLGFIYGLLYISKHYLGVKPFWFWMEQKFVKRESIVINDTYVISEIPSVRLRGWFFNDEVLMMKWKYNNTEKEGWKMAFEALLRCGGNMAIPGTDKLSVQNRKLAADMGLWITHHHAEPLGAQMFVRAYPDMEANYLEHPQLFENLWEEAVFAQKDCKVVWNVCFRGQGDMPFWSSDATGQFDTEQKRGKMISDVIRRQCDIVRKHVESPIFCTNLYGEIMELYEKGLIDLDTDVIKVRADNGYGKMVTRRRDNHTVRVSSMPDKKDKGLQGIYYHVSFYDLQAANHITMLPNSVDFVDRELSAVLENGGEDFWIINCSNVKPHVYFLDAIRKKWFGKRVSDVQHSREFAADYFGGEEQIATCFVAYPKAMISYGTQEDEHMGEQFYTETIRILAHQFLVDKSQNCESLYWIVGDVPYTKQVEKLCKMCACGLERLSGLVEQCEKVRKLLGQETLQLFDGTIYLQARIHAFCARGMVLFGEAFEAFKAQEYARAFVLFGRSAECFDAADKAMRDSEHGVWEGFYLNECLADIKHTAYMVRKVMGYVREFGDNVRHDKWYREYCYAKEDKKVFLLLVQDNHMTDWELYLTMKNSINILE